jgi:mono/diheme cytochrome c family protein
MKVIRFLTAALLAGIATAPAVAQSGDPQKGHALARDICASCHAVDAGAADSPVPDAASFQAIARTPGMNEMALNAALHTSHKEMPNLILTTPEVRNVIAYILSLN